MKSLKPFGRRAQTQTNGFVPFGEDVLAVRAEPRSASPSCLMQRDGRVPFGSDTAPGTAETPAAGEAQAEAG